MLGEGDAPARLRNALRFFDPATRLQIEGLRPRESGSTAPGESLSHLEVFHVGSLRAMLLDSSDAIRGVASYRIAELRLGQLEHELRALGTPSDGALAELSDRAVDLFDQKMTEVPSAG